MIWLDVLPLEICERIAAHLSEELPGVDELHLAETSPKQRKAVVSGRGYKLENACHVDNIDRWVDVFEPDVVDVEADDLSSAARWKPDVDVPIARLLLSPNLRRAKVDDDPAVLRVVAQSASLRELHITVLSSSSSEFVFEALSALNLTALTLACKANMGSLDRGFFRESQGRCPLKGVLFGPSFRDLASCCPQVSTLGIRCDRHRQFPVPVPIENPLWRLLETLPALREVTFDDYAPVNALPRLRALESVRMGYGAGWFGAGKGSYSLAMQIGAPVIELNCMGLEMSREQVALLKQCPRLEKLAMKIVAGADGALPDVVKNLPLRELEISWKDPGPGAWPEIPGWADDDNGLPEPYAAAVPGALLHAVRNSPNLEALAFIFVRIECSELVAILRSVGRRLRTFETSIGDQDESRIDRLEALLHASAMYNSELRSFIVCDDHVSIGGDGEDDLQSSLHRLGGNSLHPLLAARRRLRRCAPYSYDPRLDDAIAIETDGAFIF